MPSILKTKMGLRFIANCIFTGGHGYSVHGDGSKQASVNNYLIEKNICYNTGRLHVGGYKPCENIRVFQNTLYNVPMQLGFPAPYNENCELRNNLIINGELTIDKFKKTVDQGNLVLKKGESSDKWYPRCLAPEQIRHHTSTPRCLQWRCAKGGACGFQQVPEKRG